MNFQLCNMECKNGTLSPLRPIFAFALKREREPIRQNEEGSRSICFYYGLFLQALAEVLAELLSKLFLPVAFFLETSGEEAEH